MMNIRICAESDIPEVKRISDIFLAENCCNGMVENSEDYLRKYEIWLAEYESRIIGYGYGEKQESKYIIEEIYVIPEFRNRGAGAELYKKLEQRARETGCGTIELFAVSKNYKSLLKFYIDEMGMYFWSAKLRKNL